MDYDKEVSSFCTKLEQARDKFITNWSTDEYDELKHDILLTDNKQLQRNLGT